MTTYKETRGTNIQSFSSDPANPIAGQVWYNTTSNALKVSDGPVVSAWATANSMNTARQSLAGTGTQTAALAFGGWAPGRSALTESYNGTNWTEVNDLNSARSALGGAGTTTAALAFGGKPATAATEEFSETGGTTTIDTE